MKMNTATRIASIALVALVAGTSLAQAQAGPKKVSRVSYLFGISCLVQGQPVEFPDDLWLTNKSAGTYAKGTKLGWHVPYMNYHGTHTLTADLKPGQSVFLSNVLPGGVEAGRGCGVSLAK